MTDWIDTKISPANQCLLDENARADRKSGLPRSGILTRNRETGQAFAPSWHPALEHEAHPLRLISMVAARREHAA
jgi:hypothetical protein